MSVVRISHEFVIGPNKQAADAGAIVKTSLEAPLSLTSSVSDAYSSRAGNHGETPRGTSSRHTPHSRAAPSTPGHHGGAHTSSGGRAAIGRAGTATGEVADYIRQSAARRGINPNVAVAVANSEGLRGYYTTGIDRGGDRGSSFGPFQLHYGGVAGGSNRVGGLGDVFTRQTGLNARDRGTWKSQVDFALQHAAKHGWGAWHGAANTGIGRWQGIHMLPSGGYVRSK